MQGHKIHSFTRRAPYAARVRAAIAVPKRPTSRWAHELLPRGGCVPSRRRVPLLTYFPFECHLTNHSMILPPSNTCSNFSVMSPKLYRPPLPLPALHLQILQQLRKNLSRTRLETCFKTGLESSCSGKIWISMQYPQKPKLTRQR